MRSRETDPRRRAGRGLPVVAAIVLAVACGAPSAPRPSADPADPAGVTSAAELALSLPALRFAMTTDGGRVGRPPLRVTEATGIVDLAQDRGAMDYVPHQQGRPGVPMHVRWSSTELWVAIAATGPTAVRWIHTTRASSRSTAFLGAAQEEPRALFSLIATAQPDEITARPADGVDGVDGVREWVVAVRFDRAGNAFVPPYHYERLVKDRPNNILSLEVSILDGQIIRIRYDVDAAPPRRYITTYTWTTERAAFDAEIPPRGPTDEMP